MRLLSALCCIVPPAFALLAACPRPAAAQWQLNGEPACGSPRAQIGVRSVSDGAGGAIVTWVDLRNGNGDIFAQRLSEAGQRLWGSDGNPVCVVRGDQDPLAAVSDGAGGVILVWHDYRCGSSVFAQRIDADGRILWDPGGVALASSAEWQVDPVGTSDGHGGLIAVWLDGRGANYAQRIDAEGRPRWGPAGVPVGGGYVTSIEADGSGGAIFAFTGIENGHSQIMAQRVDSTGALSWPGGVTVFRVPVDGVYADAAVVIADGAGGALLAWEDVRAGNYYHVYAQRLGPAGNAEWTPNGVAVCTANGGQVSPQMVADGTHGTLVVWKDGRNGNGSDIYARRVSASGDTLWQTYGNPVCTASGVQEGASIVSDGAGGAIVTWQDGRGPARDIYAQRFTGAGQMLWATNGVPLCTAAGDQTAPLLVSDGQGGAIAAWNDARISPAESRIFAQRVDASGSAPGTLPVPLTSSGPFRVFPAIPNPARVGAAVEFALPAGAAVSAEVVDVSGRRIRSLAVRQRLPAGTNHLTWDGRDVGGAPVPAGLYFVRVGAGAAEGYCKVVISR